MDLVEFWTKCAINGIVLDEEQREQLKRYHQEMLYWNKQVNLISRKDEENFLEKHLFHSLSVLKYVDIPEKSKCMDVGTGGGLPGLPIAVAAKHIEMTLVDSIKKKVNITRIFAQHTTLRNLKVINARVEELADFPDYKNKMDFIFARGVASIKDLVTWTKPMLKKNGKYVLLKGGDLTEEITEAVEAFPSLRVEEKLIKFIGYDYFEKEEKKILICHLIN
mgnify:CR=1 FL=1